MWSLLARLGFIGPRGVNVKCRWTEYVTVLALITAVPTLGCGSKCLAQAPATGRLVVVELFTSQGCSSCPPADAVLGELATRPNVIALGFHVDYWDSIGWRDRYSMPEATERQRRYVEALRLSSAFTPQVVIDGRRSFVGSDRQRIVAAIAEAPRSISIEVAVVHEELVVSLPEGGDHHHYDVNLVAYVPQATTQVGRGENSGRTLTEFNIVRQFRRLGIWEGKSTSFRVPLVTFPSDANRVAILVQQGNQGPIAGAVASSLR
jgi:hypothetical protein